jgi:hypothetical protein
VHQELVTGRECGECNVCCVDLIIDSKEFQKLPGVRCRHLCAGGGCAIYETRYPTCRSYFCGWRYMHFIGDEWRPDRSRVLFDWMSTSRAVKVLLLARPPKNIMRTLCEELARLIAAGVQVVLAVPGPPGHAPAHWNLNESVAEAAAKGDLAYMEGALSEALALIDAAADRFLPVVFENNGTSRP